MRGEQQWWSVDAKIPQFVAFNSRCAIGSVGGRRE